MFQGTICLGSSLRTFKYCLTLQKITADPVNNIHLNFTIGNQDNHQFYFLITVIDILMRHSQDSRIGGKNPYAGKFGLYWLGALRGKGCHELHRPRKLYGNIRFKSIAFEPIFNYLTITLSPVSSHQFFMKSHTTSLDCNREFNPCAPHGCWQGLGYVSEIYLSLCIHLAASEYNCNCNFKMNQFIKYQ